jgi:hypothetical protein
MSSCYFIERGYSNSQLKASALARLVAGGFLRETVSLILFKRSVIRCSPVKLFTSQELVHFTICPLLYTVKCLVVWYPDILNSHATTTNFKTIFHSYKVVQKQICDVYFTCNVLVLPVTSSSSSKDSEIYDCVTV